MSRELKGIANHVFNENEITGLEVHVITVEGEKTSHFVTVGEEHKESIIIHSMEQWEQLNALVRKSFDGLSEQ